MKFTEEIIQETPMPSGVENVDLIMSSQLESIHLPLDIHQPPLEVNPKEHLDLLQASQNVSAKPLCHGKNDDDHPKATYMVAKASLQALSPELQKPLLDDDTTSKDDKDYHADVVAKALQAEAPDGGWGWVVLAAVFLSFCTLGYQFGGFSVMYVALVEHFESERGVTGWIGSMFIFTGNFLGIVIGAFVHRFGCRRVAFVGGVIGGLGIGLSSFLVSIPYLYITYGIISGIGHATIYIANLVILQHYFNKRRALAIGIGSSGLAVGAMAATPIISVLLDRYGVQGTYLLSAGIWLQNTVFAMLYRPVRHIEKLNKLSESSSSMLRDMLNVKPLRNRKLVLFLLGTFLYSFSSYAFYAHFLSRAVHIGVGRAVANKLQILLTFVSGVSRIGFSFIGNIKGVNRVLAYGFLVLCSGLTTVTLFLAKTAITLVVYATLMGFFAGGMYTVQPTVLVDVSGVRHIAKTTGLMNMIVCSAILVGIPVAGFVFDVTSDYDIPFFVTGAVHCLGGLVLIALAVLNSGRWKDAKSLDDGDSDTTETSDAETSVSESSM